MVQPGPSSEPEAEQDAEAKAEAEGEAVLMEEDLIQQSLDDYDAGKYSPRLLGPNELPFDAHVLEAEEDTHRLLLLRQQLQVTGRSPGVQGWGYAAHRRGRVGAGSGARVPSWPGRGCPQAAGDTAAWTRAGSCGCGYLPQALPLSQPNHQAGGLWASGEGVLGELSAQLCPVPTWSAQGSTCISVFCSASPAQHLLLIPLHTWAWLALQDQMSPLVPTGDATESTDDIFFRKAKEGMGADEAQFSVEMPLTGKAYLWADKYRPRKPRFFNRVHTGFEWNKYNQTHYDFDNPPPKIVQGYKFNIFYPDLIDKRSTPEYFLEACQDNKDFAILRFHAGPPYEDIAFKIVNREWEYSHRHGFRCQFANGIFQLWFHFKRYRYRR